MDGVVQRWLDRYGWIEYQEGRGKHPSTVFFCGTSIVPDTIGRTADAKIPGSPVQFEIITVNHKGKVALRADNVEALFREKIQDPEAFRTAYREISVVHEKSFNSCLLRRDSGDFILLKRQDVVDVFQDRFADLRVGDRVFHGVAAPAEERKTWRAVEAEIFSREEQEELYGSE